MIRRCPRKKYQGFVRRFLFALSFALSASQAPRCTYDSTPPDDSKINDSKQLLMIDAAGFTGQRGVQIQYTDILGTTTLQTSAETTDSSGRFLYALYLARGTRAFTLTLIVDQSGDGLFTSGSGDRKYQLSSAFTADSETRKLTLTNSADFAAN